MLRALSRQAAVVLIGPRQIGKTTLALEIANSWKAIYLDLEACEDREKLRDPDFVVYAGLGRYPVTEKTDAISLTELVQELKDKG